MLLCAGAISCGERWLQAVTKVHDHRWNVRTLIDLGFLVGLRHFSVELFDLLFDIVEDLKKTSGVGEDFEITELKDFMRTPDNVHVIPSGFFPSKKPGTPPPPFMDPRMKLDDWYKIVMDEERDTNWTSPGDVAAVLRLPEFMLKGDASGISAQAGVKVASNQVLKKALEVAGEEMTMSQLDAHGWGRVMQQLRAAGPRRGLHVPTPASQIAGPIPAPLPSGVARSGLSTAAAATSPQDSEKRNPGKRKADKKKDQWERRRRLRNRQEGTAAEQNAEILRHEARLLKRRESDRKRRFGA